MSGAKAGFSALIVHDPGADLAPARRAAAAAGVALTAHEAADEFGRLEGLEAGRARDAVLVTPPPATAPGDAYQVLAAELTAAGLSVVEVTPENRAATDPAAPGPVGAMAAVAGLGDAGFALALELLAARRAR